MRYFSHLYRSYWLWAVFLFHLIHCDGLLIIALLVPCCSLLACPLGDRVKIHIRLLHSLAQNPPSFSSHSEQNPKFLQWLARLMTSLPLTFCCTSELITQACSCSYCSSACCPDVSSSGADPAPSAWNALPSYFCVGGLSLTLFISLFQSPTVREASMSTHRKKLSCSVFFSCPIDWSINWSIYHLYLSIYPSIICESFQSSFRFRPKLRGRYRDFPSTHGLPHYQHSPKLHLL